MNFISADGLIEIGNCVAISISHIDNIDRKIARAYEQQILGRQREDIAVHVLRFWNAMILKRWIIRSDKVSGIAVSLK